MAPRRILVFPDCGPRIGGGHVMRCLTLACALTARGAAVTFAANPAAQAVLTNFGARDITVFPISDDLEEAVPATLAWAQSWKADAVLLDHYFLTAQQEAAFGEGRALAVIDDLADRPRPAGLLLNPGYASKPADYADLVPSGAVVLTGPSYALVRPEFAAHRERSLAHRHQGGHLKHVLISLGLTDVGGVTGRVVKALRPRLDGLMLDVVMGDGASSLVGLRAQAKTDCALRLHIDTHAMAELMVQADLCVGAGGGSAWERATVGLPTVTVVLADNQRPMAQAMARDGLTLALDAADKDFEAELVAAVLRLVEDSSLRRSLAEKAAAACDGQGAARVADALLAL